MEAEGEVLAAGTTWVCSQAERFLKLRAARAVGGASVEGVFLPQCVCVGYIRLCSYMLGPCAAHWRSISIPR